MKELEKQFHEQMLATYQIVGNRTGYWANRFLRLVKRRGGLAAAKHFLSKPNISNGFRTVQEAGLQRFSVEHLVTQKPWSRLFTSAEITIARKRLKESDDATSSADESDRSWLKSVSEHLRRILTAMDEENLIQWQKPIPATMPTESDGWMITLGNLGKRHPSFELWFDCFPGTGNRCLWFGFSSKNQSGVQKLIQKSPERLFPRRVFKNKNFKNLGEFYYLYPKLNRADFDYPVHEIYYHKYSFFGIYDSTESTSSREARKAAQRAAKFIADVLHIKTPIANDIETGQLPGRVKLSVNRIIRDTCASRRLKNLYESKCQVCGTGLEIEPGVNFAEAHHLRPLGGTHKGPDIRSNLICLCPNHHAQFDYFAIPINPSRLKLKKHHLGKDFVQYHNTHVLKNRKAPKQ